MTRSATGLDQRQIIHREALGKQRGDPPLYRDYHRRLLESCPEGRILDIGGGTAHIKEFRPDVVSADILSFPGIDVVADAHRLPFPERIFCRRGDARRSAPPGAPDRIPQGSVARTQARRAPRDDRAGDDNGRAGQFYDRFHEEPVDMKADPFAPVAINPDRDPFDANQAIPTLLFATRGHADLSNGPFHRCAFEASNGSACLPTR